MSHFELATKNKPCPICGRCSDCRSKDGLFHCLDVTSQASSPVGWRFVGVSKIGFGLFVLDNGKPSYTAPKQPPAKDIKQIQYSGLTIQERGLAYANLLNQLSLDALSSAWLNRKGLPVEAQVFWRLRDYFGNFQLKGLPEKLPGLSRCKSRLTQRPILLLPVPNHQGQVLGCQVVPHKRVDCEMRSKKWRKEDGPKYFWLSSAKSGGQGPTLPAPYLSVPQGFYRPPHCQQSETLYLSEGILKSMVIAWRMGWPVVGTASGGRFCETQLKEVIESGGFKRIVLIPDAGMLHNAHIAKAYAQTAKTAQKLGFPLWCLWWGQNNKTGLDFDDYLLKTEALNGPQYDIIPFDEYFLKQHKDYQMEADAVKTQTQVFMLRPEKQTTPNPPLDIKTIRSAMAESFKQVILNAGSKEFKLLHLFQQPAGMGKTTTLCNVLLAVKRENALPGRVLILVKTKERMAEVERVLGDAAFYVYGRDPEKGAFHCQRYEEFSRIAQARYNPGAFCSGCKEELDLLGWPCDYKHQMKKAEKAEIVVSTYASYLGDSTRLEPFKLIVVDESLVDAGITEPVTLSRKRDLEKIREFIAKNPVQKTLYHPEHPLWPVLDLLDNLMKLAEYEQDAITDIVAAMANHQGESKIKALLEAEPDVQEHFGFEQVGKLQEGSPRRVLWDLLAALTDGKGRFVIGPDSILFERQRACVETLKAKTVINLDATPIHSLLNAVFDGKVTTYGLVDLVPNCNITQVIGKVLAPHWTSTKQLDELSDTLSEVSQPFKKPFVLMPKSWVPDSKKSLEEQAKTLRIGHPDIQIGWWGNHHRGANDFQGCDVGFIVGNFQPPPHAVRIKVNALRNDAPSSEPPSEALVQMALVGNHELVPFRMQTKDADPLLHSVFEEMWAAEYAQAIGRLRAINKPHPMPIYLVNGYFIQGLPINNYVTYKDFV
jgi:hypothetical protein